jgi:hypothetical protein
MRCRLSCAKTRRQTPGGEDVRLALDGGKVARAQLGQLARRRRIAGVHHALYRRPVPMVNICRRCVAVMAGTRSAAARVAFRAVHSKLVVQMKMLVGAPYVSLAAFC